MLVDPLKERVWELPVPGGSGASQLHRGSMLRRPASAAAQRAGISLAVPPSPTPPPVRRPEAEPTGGGASTSGGPDGPADNVSGGEPTGSETTTTTTSSGLTKNQKKSAKKKAKKKAAKTAGGTGASKDDDGGGGGNEDEADSGPGGTSAYSGQAPSAAVEGPSASEFPPPPRRVEMGEVGPTEEASRDGPKPTVIVRPGLTEEQLETAACKLVDFGNACWTYKQFTDDVQTRQYR